MSKHLQRASKSFKEELGCLKDVKLDIKFKSDAKPKLCKTRLVALALQEDLNAAYDTGMKPGIIWKPVTFNSWGTPVVPIRKVCIYPMVSGSSPTSAELPLRVRKVASSL